MSKKKNLKTSDRIDCLWGLVCSLSSIDQQRNNISLFNVIDQLNIPKQKIPKLDEKGGFMVPLGHEIVLVWRRLLSQDLCGESVTVDLKITTVDPAGNVLGEILTQLKFEVGKRLVRFRVQNNAFRLTSEGDYVYRVDIVQPGTNKFEKATEIPFNVKFI